MHVLYAQPQVGTWGPWSLTCTALCCTAECICIPLIKQRYCTVPCWVVRAVMYCIVLYCTVARKGTRRNRKNEIWICVPCSQLSWLLFLSCLVLSCVCFLWCDMVTCRVIYAGIVATVQPAINPSISFLTIEYLQATFFPLTSPCLQCPYRAYMHLPIYLSIYPSPFLTSYFLLHCFYCITNMISVSLFLLSSFFRARASSVYCTKASPWPLSWNTVSKLG